MKILVCIMSCMQNKELWANKLKIYDNSIIFVGGAKETYYDNLNRVLYLNCNDLYDGLVEKMILLIEIVVKFGFFNDITHILKIDDHDTKFNENNITDLYNNELVINNDYVGQKINKCIPNETWHYGKVSEESFWFNKPYNKGRACWLDGGCGYILSKKAMQIINLEYNSSNINILNKEEIYEDVTIGKILKKKGILPVLCDFNIIGDKSKLGRK